MIWSPLIIYSTVGTLLLVISYDFIRYFIPTSRYGGLWFYEHIFKMIGAFTALLSAFSGTVFNNYQPYSQFLPSVFGTVLQIGFIVYYYPSALKLLTGLLIAALIAWKLTVIKAMSRAARPARAKVHPLIVIR